MQDKYDLIKTKVDCLEKNVDKILSILETMTSNVDKIIEKDYCTEDEHYELADRQKLNADDIERFYNKLGYDEWLEKVVMPHKNTIEKFDDGNHKKEVERYDNWQDNVEDSNNLYVMIANVVAWFDTAKIATMILANNEAADDKELLITSMNVDSFDYNSIKTNLDENVKECVEDLILNGPANDTQPFKEFQIGRVHLISVKDDDCSFLKLYWTSEETES